MSHLPPRPLGARERFVAFAFAAADLLVEVGTDGRIVFAAGAFRARLGRSPESLIGRLPTDLIAPEDRAAFSTAVAMLPLRGRLAPTTFRLANATRSPLAVAGLHLLTADRADRLCLTFAPVPAPPDRHAADAEVLLREAGQRLQAGEDNTLGLIELTGPAVPAAESRFEGLLGSAVGGGTVAARLAPGRYGLLAEEGRPLPDLPELAAQLEALLRRDGDVAQVATAAVPLSTAGLSPAQAARALRHGLDAFARRGTEGLGEAGFTEGLGGVVARVTRRAGEFRKTIAGRRFRLDYQPIVDLATRELHHHEALIRPEREVLEPGEGPQDFVALAETVGLTEELDLAVASVVMATTHLLPPGRHIAFNVSGLSVQSSAFRRRLLALLDSDIRAARRIMVELTESAEIEDEGAAAATLQALRARGVPICIDDFGAGAAAFRYLKTFPTDYVKVDGAFVTAALTSERDRSFVAAMVDLSLAVGARVVAERIESEDGAHAMQALGVHYGQGWHFGKPGPL